MSTKSQTTDDETSAETESKCDDEISTCQSLQNLIDCLIFYQSVDITKDKEKILVYFTKYKDLINDYHFVLCNHLNRDQQTLNDNNEAFKSIHEYILEHNIQSESNINKCAIHIRNNRHREDDKYGINDKMLSFYIDIMDTIYCLFVHSYHYKIRQSIQTQSMQTDDDDKKQHKMDKTFSFKDIETINLKQQMQPTRHSIHHLRGDLRFDHNRFYTKTTETSFHETKQNENEPLEEYGHNEYQKWFFDPRHSIDEMSDFNSDSEDGCIPRQRELGSNYHSFGHRFYYWDYYKYEFGQKHYVHKKYKNLKDEMLNNVLCKLNLSTYDYIHFKATKLCKESDELRGIKSAYTESALHYGIDEGVSLNVSNIMTILMYTDYHLLSAHFRKTFRKLSFYEESIEDIKRRNSEFWHFSKTLRESVECFGEMMINSKINRYYHCIDPIVFSSFCARFCGPMSVTPRIEIAALFVDEKGAILEMNPCEMSSSLRVFNCSLISSSAHEEERLFFGGIETLQIASIRLMKSDENLKDFVNAVKLLDNVINAEYVNCDDQECSVEIVKKLMNRQEEKNVFSKYVNDCFDSYCSSIKQIEIELAAFTTHYEPFKQLFVDRRSNNLILIDFICDIFQNCIKIVIDNNGRHLSSRYFNQLLTMIGKIDGNENIKLRVIKVERVTFDEAEFDGIKDLFLAKKWEIEIKKTRAVQFGVWTDIANLSVYKLEPSTDKMEIVRQSVTKESIENQVTAKSDNNDGDL